MEYEHEKKIRRWVELELYRYGHHFREYDAEVIKELKDVYAKAKAWDNYLADVDSSVREISNNEDEVKWHVDYAINEYMEVE